MSTFIQLEPSVNGTIMRAKGNRGQLVKMLADCIVCHPPFREIVYAAMEKALEYEKQGGHAQLIDLNETPIHPTEN